MSQKKDLFGNEIGTNGTGTKRKTIGKSIAPKPLPTVGVDAIQEFAMRIDNIAKRIADVGLLDSSKPPVRMSSRPSEVFHMRDMSDKEVLQNIEKDLEQLSQLKNYRNRMITTDEIYSISVSRNTSEEELDETSSKSIHDTDPCPSPEEENMIEYDIDVDNIENHRQVSDELHSLANELRQLAFLAKKKKKSG